MRELKLRTPLDHRYYWMLEKCIIEIHDGFNGETLDQRDHDENKRAVIHMNESITQTPLGDRDWLLRLDHDLRISPCHILWTMPSSHRTR